MELLYKTEHLACPNYDKSEKPSIEEVRFVKGAVIEMLPIYNEAVCILEGRLKYILKEQPNKEVSKGQILFLPASVSQTCIVLENTMVLIFRIYNPVMLCANFQLESLSNIGRSNEGRHTRQLGCLEINSRMWHLTEGIQRCMEDGMKCRCWFEIKLKEFLLMLRAYYPKKELYDFFSAIISVDTVFSEHIRLHWRRYRTVGELADSLNMSPKQFATRFVATFKKTPHKWIAEETARMIYTELTATNKQFKQIAAEHCFNSDSQFTRFCRKEFNRTPSQIRDEKNDAMEINVK